MDTRLLHIFRNTPLGRENLLQTIYFCKNTGAKPVVYIPEATKFLMYFENDVVQVDLDSSYLTSPETAQEHASKLLKDAGIIPYFLKPKNHTASTLPDIPVNFDFMVSPRSISDISTKVGLGHIGSRVRRIVKSAHFPVLITSPVYKEWQCIAVFFGGSANAVNALKLGIRISRVTGMPLEMFTQLEGNSREYYEDIIRNEGLEQDVGNFVRKWNVYDAGKFEENIYNVPHDALVVLGAYGHGVIRDIFFGSKMETIQTVMPNNFLVAGPHYVLSGKY